MPKVSSNSASSTVSKLIRRARLTLRLSCDPQARTTARQAKLFWLSAATWLDLTSLTRLLVLDRLDNPSVNPFIDRLAQPPFLQDSPGSSPPV